MNPYELYMDFVKKAVQLSVPKGINFQKQFETAQELISKPIGTRFRRNEQLMNCATAAQHVLAKGGIATKRVDSLSPQHPMYSASYRGGVRSTQFGEDSPTLKGVTLSKLDAPDHMPEKGKHVYLQQRILRKKDDVPDAEIQKFIKGESNLTANDLYNPHDYIEHTVPIVWHGDAPHVFDARKKKNQLIPYHEYLKGEMSGSNVGRVHTQVARLADG